MNHPNESRWNQGHVPFLKRNFMTLSLVTVRCHSYTHLGWMLTSLHKKIQTYGSWQTLKDFQLNKKYANSLAVVNDRAERTVKLMPDYNSSITSEEQKQYLLLVVSSHRAKYPEDRSCCLSAMTFRSIRVGQLRSLMTSDCSWFKKTAASTLLSILFKI